MAAVTEDHQAQAKKLKTKAKASLALLLVALISVSTATYAWFTLSNSTSVQSMIVEVGTGTTLKAFAGTNTSSDVADYFAVIKSEGTQDAVSKGEIITDALPKKAAFPSLSGDIKSLAEIKLWPVTSGNGKKLYTQGLNGDGDGTDAGPEKKYYMHLTLTFISDTTMDVYLNGSNSTTDPLPDEEDGTLVSPGVVLNQTKPGGGKYTQAEVDAAKNAVKALRISFESVGTVDDLGVPVYAIYEPDNTNTAAPPKAETTTLSGHALADLRKLPGHSTATVQQTFTTLGDNTGRHNVEKDSDTPVLFSLIANEPKVVTVRMWVEGEDAQCINDPEGVNIEKALLRVRFRFCGADEDGNFIETAPRA